MSYSTQWTRATTNPAKAIKALISCLQAGNVAFIARINNKDAVYPIQIKNPALNYHKNWEMAYGVPFNRHDVDTKNYFNKTEEDLTRNYTYSFDHYRCKNGHLFIKDKTKSLICPMCSAGYKDCHQECRPVKLDDPGSRTWVTVWRPKKEFPYWLPASIDGKVLTVAYYDDPKEAKWFERLMYYLYSPLKFIPQKDYMNMGDYKTITYRIGGIINGFKISFQIPKKFGFRP